MPYDQLAGYDQAVPSRLAPPAAAAPAGTVLEWVTLDLSAATKSDPGGLLKTASSVLGTTSTLVLNTGIHGAPDAGRDGLCFFWNVAAGITWADYAGMIIRQAATAFGGVGSGNQVRHRAGLVTAADQAAAAGALAGVVVQSGGNRYTQHGSIGGASNSGAANVGALVAVDTWVPFHSAGPLGAGVVLDGPSGQAAAQQVDKQSPTDAIVCLGYGNAAPFTAEPSTTGLVVSYALVPR